MRDPSDITALQAEILELVWGAGEASAAEVREGLHRQGLARTTVATMLARMEQYGWLTRSRDGGREFTYRAAVARTAVRGAQVGRMVRALFPEDLPSLVSHALREGDWEEDDLARIEELVRQHRATLERAEPDR